MMEILKNTDSIVFKEGIPKHVTSGNVITFSLGKFANCYWVIDISFHKQDDHLRTIFSLPENLQNVVTKIKFRCRSLENKLFAVGCVQLFFAISPESFEVCLFNKQFHHLFEEVNTQAAVECTGKNIDTVLKYVRDGQYTRNCMYMKGEITLYSVHESDLTAKSSAESLKSDVYINKLRYESLNQLSLELTSLLKESIHTDINLKCGNEIIGAHKAILSARSPVFAAMLQSPMKENIENEIDFEDMDPFIFRSLVEYLYSGDVCGLNNHLACELLSVAETYQLSGLKKICADIIEGAITTDNALRTLVFADLYEEELKKTAMDVICKNYDCLKTTFEWKTLELERPALIFEVMDYKIQSLK